MCIYNCTIASQMLLWSVVEGDVKSFVRETKLASSCRDKDITVSWLFTSSISLYTGCNVCP